jgi:hypothetical protein
MAAPFFVGLAFFIADMAGTWTFGAVGGLIGEAVCPAQ